MFLINYGNLLKMKLKRNDKITFGNGDNKISEYNKLRFSSDVDLPLDTLIEFHMLTIVINCVIEKGNKYYPEIYLDECLYKTDIKHDFNKH